MGLVSSKAARSVIDAHFKTHSGDLHVCYCNTILSVDNSDALAVTHLMQVPCLPMCWPFPSLQMGPRFWGLDRHPDG